MDRDYRDPVRAPNDGIVPTQLSHWRVKIGFDSKQQRVEIFAESSIRGPNLDQLRIFVNQQKDELTKIQPRHTAVLFESARTIVNGFSLVAEEDEGGASPVQKLRIEVGNDFRQIGVECNEMRTMPMAWRECLLEVIAAVNEAIEPGHEKIRPIPDAE
ncbi:MAG: hypothetical protein ACKV0T_31890 [Planctomycetales bacterium]